MNRKAVVKELQVGLSFFEIYADELYDLLNGRTKARQRLPQRLLLPAPHPPTPSFTRARTLKSVLWCRCAVPVSASPHNVTHVLQGLTEKPVRDPQDIMRLMEEGSAQRATGSTGANEWSSRSHAVMQVRSLLQPVSAPRIPPLLVLCSSS